MDVKVTVSGYHTREMNVASFIDDCTDPEPYMTTGQLECAEEKARRTSQALGRLIETLMDKGLLSMEEMKEISGTYDTVEPL